VDTSLPALLIPPDGAPGRALLNTNAASQFLEQQFGVKRAPVYLRKLRCIGGGPTFRRFGRTPLYHRDDLIKWVEAGLSTPVSSTSELSVRGSNRHRGVQQQIDVRTPARDSG
jgi:hypothetical protein